MSYYSDKDLAERSGITAQTDYATIVNSFILQSFRSIGGRSGLADEASLHTLGGQAPGFMRTPGLDGAIIGHQNYGRRLVAALENLLDQDEELIAAVEAELRRLR